MDALETGDLSVDIREGEFLETLTWRYPGEMFTSFKEILNFK